MKKEYNLFFLVSRIRHNHYTELECRIRIKKLGNWKKFEDEAMFSFSIDKNHPRAFHKCYNNLAKNKRYDTLAKKVAEDYPFKEGDVVTARKPQFEHDITTCPVKESYVKDFKERIIKWTQYHRRAKSLSKSLDSTIRIIHTLEDKADKIKEKAKKIGED